MSKCLIYIEFSTLPVNMIFVGSLSLNPRKQSEINFIGKRSEYKISSGESIPISTTLDGEHAYLNVDITNQNVLYVDWMVSGRRNDIDTNKQYDILSVRSWKMTKDKGYCYECGGVEPDLSKASKKSKTGKKY